MSENLEFWNKVKKVPEASLKEIKGGRLKGKSDINPIWRYQVMTEHFGPCGVGWKYQTIKKWIEQGHGAEKVAFVDIELFTKNDGEWSEPIPGNGGSMFVEQEKNGVHTSDEAYKMATTDALSVAMKMLGIGADVYAGLWDGSKYLEKPSDGNGGNNGGGKTGNKKMTDKEASEAVKQMTKDLQEKGTTPDKTSEWWKSNAKEITKLPKKYQDQITKAFNDHKKDKFIKCPDGAIVSRESCETCKEIDGCSSVSK